MQNDALWRVPYLPVDPADLGRDYEAVIRVNSQSGKGGFAWVLEQDQGLKLPKPLQAHFSRHVQGMADELGRELEAADIWQAFRAPITSAAPTNAFAWSITRKAAPPTARASLPAPSPSRARNSASAGAAMA